MGDREANSMTITGEHNTDILMDEKGQPVPDENGDFKILSDDECWRQDIMLETVTAEGELFYEDATGNERYGFGLTDFIHAEKNDFLEMEIGQRVKAKIDKRTFLDSRKTKQNIEFLNDKFRDSVSISKNDSNEQYNMEFIAEDITVL